MTPLRTAVVLIVLFAFRQAASRAAEYEQRQGGAVLRLEADKVEDGVAETRLSSEMRLTLTVEGAAPLMVGTDDDAAVKEQVQALKASGPWCKCEALGKPERTALPGGRERWRLDVRLDPAKDGKLELKPAALDYAEGPSAEKRQAAWQPIPVRVTTTVASTDVRKELRDITPPEDIPAPPSWLRHLPWVGLAAAAAGLVAGGWGLRRRFLRPEPPPEPHDWAAAELTRLEGLNLPAAGEVERYHTLVGDVVRVYLEQRYQLPASHQTTTEFLETMRRAPQLTKEQQALLRDFLQRCDMAKFARAAPTPDECRAVADMARSFVQQTRPAPRP